MIKRFGILLLLVGLFTPTFVGCGSSDNVELPENIDQDSHREKEMEEDTQTSEAPPPPEEG